MALPARTSDPAPSARRRMPRSRRGTTTSFQVAGTEFCVIANADEHGSLGEVFARFGKEGSTTAGLMDLLSAAVSLGLQHGVPLEEFVAKFRNQRFEPMGMTDDPDIPDDSEPAPAAPSSTRPRCRPPGRRARGCLHL
jgi:ribonucleoside-diphosphate reductase alpha chain